jgi:perosamine synthetase
MGYGARLGRETVDVRLKAQPCGLRNMIPYGRQSIDEADIAAIVEVLRGNWLTCGPFVERFEQSLAGYCGAKHAIAVANGTAALHVAMLAAGIKPGDRVLTSANTFLASANCAEFVGATADFADIDPCTYNVTSETFAEAWKPDVRAVVAVDFAGQPCDMAAISALARSRGATVIEDASHSIGSQFLHEGKWYKVGGHPWADLTTFSFHPVKTITTGEGGAILTDNDKLADRCRLFRSHGMVRQRATGLGYLPSVLSKTEAEEECQLLAERGPWFYEMHEVGYNYRITDIQCALGLSQLKKLDQFIQRRAEIVATYNSALHLLSTVHCPKSNGTVRPAWHLYVLRLDFDKLEKSRSQIMQELSDHGVGTQVHYIPVHLQPYYRDKYGYGLGKCPCAESYYPKCLSLPLYPAMTDLDVSRVVESFKEVVSL